MGGGKDGPCSPSWASFLIDSGFAIHRCDGVCFVVVRIDVPLASDYLHGTALFFRENAPPRHSSGMRLAAESAASRVTWTNYVFFSGPQLLRRLRLAHMGILRGGPQRVPLPPLNCRQRTHRLHRKRRQKRNVVVSLKYLGNIGDTAFAITNVRTTWHGLWVVSGVVCSQQSCSLSFGPFCPTR